jgi:hypothetical protein
MMNLNTRFSVLHVKVLTLKGTQRRKRTKKERERKMLKYRPGKKVKLSRGPARPGSNPGPVERHLSFYTSCSVRCVWGFWWFLPFKCILILHLFRADAEAHPGHGLVLDHVCLSEIAGWPLII